MVIFGKNEAIKKTGSGKIYRGMTSVLTTLNTLKNGTIRRWSFFYEDNDGTSTLLEDSISSYFKFDAATGLWHFYFSMYDVVNDSDSMSDIVVMNDASQELIRYSYRYYTPISKEWTEITIHHGFFTDSWNRPIQRLYMD